MFKDHLKGGTIIESCMNVLGGWTAGPFRLWINGNAAPISKFRHCGERESNNGFNCNWIQLPAELEAGGEEYPKGIINKQRRVTSQLVSERGE
jgi:hypothetical protein